MWIVHGLALGWVIRQGLADWNWIGRLVLDWHKSQSLPLDWGLGNGQGLHCFGELVRDWSRVGIRLQDWSRIGITLIDG